MTIKTHHNVGGLKPEMKFQLIEPLRELFKDEVRNVGRELGLPEEIVGRHPFPGPGLAIRVLSDVTQEKLDVLRKADAIYLEEIRAAGLYDDIWQAFAVLLPVRSVGVMGDYRTYENVVALARRHEHRWDDRGLVPVPARRARSHLEPNHQRGARRESRRLRHQLEAAGDDRMGVNDTGNGEPGTEALHRDGCDSSLLSDGNGFLFPFSVPRSRQTPFSSSSFMNSGGECSANSRSGTSGSLENCAIFPSTGRY